MDGLREERRRGAGFRKYARLRLPLAKKTWKYIQSKCQSIHHQEYDSSIIFSYKIYYSLLDIFLSLSLPLSLSFSLVSLS